MFIKKLYYSVWADGIKRMQEGFPESDRCGKFMLLTFMGGAFGCFSMFFFGFISRIIGLPWPQLHLPIDFWDNLLSALLFFYLPWFVIHYYLVFWKNKYQIFLPKCKYRNGELFITFFLCIIFMPLFLFIIGVIVARIMAN
jgi:hypothetical protein